MFTAASLSAAEAVEAPPWAEAEGNEAEVDGSSFSSPSGSRAQRS
jgi:hypothetical protein